jgi:DNA-binding transcriptional MerR regulator
MEKSFFGVAALSVVIAAGSAWGADDATIRCQAYAKEDGVSLEDMKDYMQQCLEDQRMASDETDQSDKAAADSASQQKD